MASKGKFIIKPFRPYCAMDGQQAKEIWHQLQAAIEQIHHKNASSLSFEELYRNAYNLVLHKHGDLLYRGVCECVRDHLANVAADVSSKADEQLLEGISTAWSEHQQTMLMVRDILMYMDRTYCQQGNKVKIYDHGLIIFRDTIARNPNVKVRLRNLLLGAVAEERRGQLVERMLVKNTLAMLADLGVDSLVVYEDDFENAFLERTREFYRQESLEYLAQNTCPDYLTKAEERLREEHERVRHYLNLSTEPKLKRIVETELITTHAKALVDMEHSGVVAMLVDSKVGDLRRMYDLLTRVPSTLDVLRNCVCDYVKKIGEELVSDQEKAKDPVEFVKKLLEMRDKYDVIVSEAFRGEKKAQKKLKDAFEEFINADTRCASYLVLYIDELLRSALKGMNEEEADAQLEKVIVIFRYLQDKDVFESFYKRYLAKRLLAGKSMSEDSERSMIAKLKTECGYHFTSKLEGMFTDMSMSKETMEQFTESLLAQDEGGGNGGGGGGNDEDVVLLKVEGGLQSAGGGGSSSLASGEGQTSSSSSSSSSLPPVELDAKVLTAAHWPASVTAQCTLPPELTPCYDSFQAFYLRKHTGRRLAWQTSLGNADLKARFGKNRHELNVSTYQMCILMRFNGPGNETQTLEVLSELGIPRDELKRHLVSLCTPKHRILKKASKGKGIEDGDSFTFNAEYTSKLKRVKIPLVSAKETSVASEALPPAVEEDRRHLVEAGIVRIMKSRKVMQHNDLIAEVTRQLVVRFSPVPNFIKKRIESLIERDYIERDKDDRRLYTYLA